MTLHDLGELTGYSTQHVGAIERGAAAPSEQFVLACEAVLGAGGQLIALLPAVIREQAAARHERQAIRRPSSSGPRTQPAPAPRASDGVGSREPGIDWERLATAGRKCVGVVDRVVDDLELITDQYRRLYHHLPSMEMVALLSSHEGLLSSLLKAPGPDHLRQRLASALAETAGFAAWGWHDLDDRFKAFHHYRLADRALHEADNSALGAYVHGFQAIACVSQGDRQAGLSLLETAVAQARNTAPASTNSWLQALQAEAWAAAGDARATARLLRRAEDQLSRVRPEDNAPWMFDFDSGRLAAFQGSCFLHLGRLKDAKRCLCEALMQLPDTCARRRGEIQIDLAQAYLASGDVEGACQFARKGLAGFVVTGSVVGLRRVRRLRAELIRSGHRKAAEELDEMLRSYIRTG